MSNPYQPPQQPDPNQQQPQSGHVHEPSGMYPQSAGAYSNYSTPPLGQPDDIPSAPPPNPYAPQGQQPNYPPQGQQPNYGPPSGQQPNYPPQGQQPNYGPPSGQQPNYAPPGQQPTYSSNPNQPADAQRTQVSPAFQQPPYQPPPSYQAPPSHYQQGAMAQSVQLPELIQATISVATKPMDPPVRTFSGRGNFIMAMAMVAIASLIGGLIGGVLAGAGSGLFGRVFANVFLSSALSWIAAFASTVTVLAMRLKMNPATRDDLATALAPGWAAIIAPLLVLGGVFGRVAGLGGIVIAAFLLLLGYTVRTLRQNNSLSADTSLHPAVISLMAGVGGYVMLQTIVAAIF